MHILIVDDNQDLANAACKLLSIYGDHTGEVALSAASALSLAAERQYGAIMIEFRLPYPEIGLNLAKKLREQGYGGLIIGLVTMPHTFTVEKMTEMGFNACLQKPLLKSHMSVLDIAPDTTCFEGNSLVYEKDRRRF